MKAQGSIEIRLSLDDRSLEDAHSPQTNGAGGETRVSVVKCRAVGRRRELV